MKIAHIADVHIRKLKYHQEYKSVFCQLYEKLREEKVDCVVVVGDIVHTKTDMSPEMISLTSDFFSNLAEVAPTYIILGNHDGNLKNSSRQDAITPIVNALNHRNLHLLKNSGEVSLSPNEKFETIRDLLGTEYTLNVLSVFDRDNWQKPSNPKNVNIALYHGSISNCKTDLNWVMENGEDTIDIFENFDYAMLGDIHRRQILDTEGRVRYCGSTIQQNHGETNDKGFLIWEIRDKKDFTVKHIELKNPKPFVTIELTTKGRIPRNTEIQEGARLRLVSSNNLPLDSIRKAAEISKRRFKPESVTFLNRAAGTRGSVEDLTNNLFKDDLRDPAIQRELIEEYLKDYQAEPKVLERVNELNKQYNSIIEKDEEVARNINWNLLSLEWDNLFNYGDGNYVNFENLSGIVGIFGKNFSGKSSVVDSLLYTLFNNTSKNSRKNLNVINQEKDFGRGKVEFLVNGKVYSIERTSEKYTKKLKGEETLEAKTDLDFKFVDELGEIRGANGLSRNDTDKNIRRILGTADDFMFTSMSAQNEALSFINEGSTRRKEILAKFLDLEIFEKKYKMAKEESVELKISLKKFEGRNFDEEIESAEAELKTNENLTKKKKNRCKVLKKNLKEEEVASKKLQDKISSIPAKIIDITKTLNELCQSKETRDSLLASNDNIKKQCAEKREHYEKICNFINTFDIEQYRLEKSEIERVFEDIDTSSGKIRELASELGGRENKITLLQNIPCGDEYPQCKFIKDAFSAREQLPSILEQISDERGALLSLQSAYNSLTPGIVDDHIEKYEQVLNKKNETANEVANCELMIEKNKTHIAILSGLIKDLEEDKAIYEENKDAIENYSGLTKEMESHIVRIDEVKADVGICEEELRSLYISHGSFLERLENIKKSKNQATSLREKYEAFDLFMSCMHPNGVSYDIIKKKLPAVNEEISKILANIVDFEAYFEEEGNKLNIFIKHPKYGPRPIEMGSGAEKSISAMAIRLALLSVSNMPKSNIFILDEPATALDEENMDGFVRILDMVKSYFKTVLLISHLDSLKDCVDTQLVIDKKKGFAYLNC